MEFTGEYTTGQLSTLMGKLTRIIAHSEAIRLDSREIWLLVKYGIRLVQFTKVSPNRWKCVINRLGDY